MVKTTNQVIMVISATEKGQGQHGQHLQTLKYIESMGYVDIFWVNQLS
jgi:hypothetical protein